MNKNRFELHEERLATTDESGHRVFLYPEDVKGQWRHKRTLFYWFLIFIYMVVPWIHFHGKQIILLDIPKREFVFFGQTFFGHDAPMLVLVLLGFVFTLGFITSIWGRVWCGWACPQTVFIDAIYRRIERMIEGKARERKALDDGPWNFQKFFKKGLKWFLYIVVSLHISHSFLGYFVGARELFNISLHSPTEHWTLFTTMLVITGIILFDFGWFREQFCIIACPYGRFQSVMMDQSSLVVGYDKKRGEPRRSPEVPKENEGDCINCYHCVKVCPTGIDIRRGTQLECIACTNCIDACDEVMVKIGKEPGLIRYDSELGFKGEPTKKFKFRSFVYLTAIAAIFVAFIIVLNKSADLKVTFLRGSHSPFQLIEREGQEQEIVNHYKLTFDYKGEKPINLSIKSVNPELIEKIRIVMPQNPTKIGAGHTKGNVFFRFEKDVLRNGTLIFPVNIINVLDDGNETILEKKDITLVGPLD